MRHAMQVVNRISALRAQLDDVRATGRTVGLVPTMGALHEGHLSLVRRSASECDVTVVTIFVNPLQFGPAEDLDAYPRPLDQDLAAASEAGTDLVFAPSVAEMYPDVPATTVSVEPLTSTHEGRARPGHLDGVATVVAKLLNASGPGRAYFGEKDFQQLQVVRRMVRDLGFPVEVVACPTVRAGDGLALSSRNAYLSAEDRRAATVLHRALSRGAALIHGGQRHAAAVRDEMVAVVAGEPRARLDYAEVVSASDLQPIERVGGEVRLLVAAWVGATRLIDNLGTSVPDENQAALCDVA